MRAQIISRLIRAPAALVMAICRSDVSSRTAGCRFRAAWVLAELGIPKRPYARERGALLGRLLASDAAEPVRARAARSLGILGTPTALRQLLQFAADESRSVRQEVATYLCKIPGKPVQGILITLATDDDPLVREMAIFSLGRSYPLGNRRVLRLLHARCGDIEDSIRHEAIRALATQGDLSVVPQLLRELDRFKVSSELVDAVQEIGFWAEHKTKRRVRTPIIRKARKAIK